ncbi:Tet(A)/Tet(B)/Tet(C) family tetracycline efflux MFS transporter [Mycobacterium sp. 21AC1]|nr:Tet(A)/Tet(B)/Tet(C) family tetracycline efflux MFS transporter [Mycobacterium sp. 21AC1]
MAVAVLDAMGLGLVMPVLPALLRTHVEPSAVALQIGVLVALYAAMQLIFAPVLGGLSDRLGRRPVLLTSLAGAAVDYLVMGTNPALWVLYVGRAVAGLTGATTAVVGSVVADVSRGDQRARRYGQVGACYGGGMIAGPMIGGVLGSLSPHLPFLMAAVLNTVGFAVAALVLRETRTVAVDSGTPGGAPGWRGLWMSGGSILSALLFTYFVIQLVGQAPASMWAVFTEHRFDWDPTQVGLSLTAFGAIHALAQALLTGPLAARFGNNRAVVMGICADAIGLLALSAAGQGWMVLPISLFLALGGVAMPGLQTLLTCHVDDRHQGRLQGVMASLTSLTGIIGPLLFAGIYVATGRQWDGWLWVCAAAAYLLCVPALLIASPRRLLNSQGLR